MDGRDFYEQQVRYLVAKDIDALIENNYTENAELHSYDNQIKGRDALKRYFRDYIEMIGDLKLKSTDKFAASDDAIMFEASVETSNLGEVRVYDSWVMEDNKIRHHFTGVLSS
ncbi:MAG: nuclear transport factor 2 family protein [Egibacteraceae bacterium]